MLLVTTTMARAQVSNQTVYTDSLQNGWIDYSWATVIFTNTTPTHTGSDSISVSATNYEGFYLHHSPFSADLYTNLTFWIYSTTGGTQSLQVQGTLNGMAQTAYQMPSLTANTWTLVTVPFSALGVIGRAEHGRVLDSKPEQFDIADLLRG